jgi:hypothetical protein
MSGDAERAGELLAELRQPGTNATVTTFLCGTWIPNRFHCVTVPDLVVWIGPRHGFGASERLERNA